HFSFFNRFSKSLNRSIILSLYQKKKDEQILVKKFLDVLYGNCVCLNSVPKEQSKYLSS
ncbi:unnamed protein product, partial [Tenebrio molitor]